MPPGIKKDRAASLQHKERTLMGKGHNQQRETKKKPAKSMAEKRAEKKAKNKS